MEEATVLAVENVEKIREWGDRVHRKNPPKCTGNDFLERISEARNERQRKKCMLLVPAVYRN